MDLKDSKRNFLNCLPKPVPLDPNLVTSTSLDTSSCPRGVNVVNVVSLHPEVLTYSSPPPRLRMPTSLDTRLYQDGNASTSNLPSFVSCCIPALHAATRGSSFSTGSSTKTI